MKTLTAAESKKAVGIAVLSALLYALYPPIAKVVLHNCPPIMLSALLYIGTGMGMAIILPLVYWLLPDMKKEASLAKTDIPTLIAVVVVNILAGILMNIGIELSTAASASLLGNFEVVATTILAFLFFHEKVGRQLWLGVGLVFTASCVLSTDVSHLTINWGSILVILATFCWGLENNFTRVLSAKNPIQIVIVKGMGVGLGTLIVALVDQENWPVLPIVGIALLLGFLSFGVSIFFYILAQRYIGAARTSAYYALSPFLSTFIAIMFLRESVTFQLVLATLMMIAGSYVVVRETFSHAE